MYQVDFDLALADGDGTDDIACATIQITGDYGNIVFADRPIRTSDLSAGLRRFTLLAVLRQIHQLEFRVHVNGARELVVDADPVLTRISAILDEPPRDDLGEVGRDPDLFARDTRRILRPQAATGFRKVSLEAVMNLWRVQQPASSRGKRRRRREVLRVFRHNAHSL